MASKTERSVVNAAGLVQGIVLVTFPAASTIFTAKSEYGLSSTQYGDMFLPQVALAIITSLLGTALARRITTKRVYLLGLACSLVSMALLLASTLVKSNQAAAYPLLLVATAFLGAGFGLTVPARRTPRPRWPWPRSGPWSPWGGCWSARSTGGCPNGSRTTSSRSSWSERSSAWPS